MENRVSRKKFVELANDRALAEIGKISYPTALKYISDRPDDFWKVGRGTYEVRDPVSDRKKEES